MYCEMAEGRASMSSFKLMMTKSTDMVVVLKVSCDRKSLHLPNNEVGEVQNGSAKKTVSIISNVR
jgi:hypothetical protein